MVRCRECSSFLDYSAEYKLYRCQNFLCNRTYTEEELFWSTGSLWAEGVFEEYPSIIAHEYWRLYSLLKQKQIYGALLQLKDVLEVLIKFPTLILLSEMYHEGKRDVEPFISLLREPLSLGHWTRIALHFKNGGAKARALDVILQDIYRIYQSHDIPNWRNEKIGHGALSFDSQACLIQDIEPLLAVLKKHFEEFSDDYRRISFYKMENGIKFELLGKEHGRNIIHSSSNLYVDHDGKTIPLFPYISLFHNGIYFFESYYPRRKKTALLNYPEGKKSEQADEVHEEISNHYKALAHHIRGVSETSSIADQTYSELEISILSKLEEVEDLQTPGFLVNDINRYFHDEQVKKGMFLLQMERGMGKTTFVRSLDELSIRKSTPKAMSVRAYYVNDTFSYKTRYFSQKLTDILRQNKHGDTVISNLLPLTTNKKGRKQDFIRFLNEYHEAYQRHFGTEKLLVILDGIDEIRNDGLDDSIFDYLPDQKLLGEKLQDGIFILLTCRSNEEVSPSIKRKLSDLSFSKVPISYKREDFEYIETLKQYIWKHFFTPQDQKSWKTLGIEKQAHVQKQIGEILKVADNRFVYVKILKDIVQINKNNLDILQSDGVFAHFIQKIEQYYGEKYFHQFLSLLTIIATAKEPLTIEELAFLHSEGKPTFKLLAFLTDMRGFLRIDRSSRGNVISISNVTWKQEITDYANAMIPQIIESFREKLQLYPLEERNWADPEYDGFSYLLAHYLEYSKVVPFKLKSPHDRSIVELMTHISSYFVAYSKSNYQLRRAKKMLQHIIGLLNDRSDKESLLLCQQAMMTNGELLYQHHFFEEAIHSSIETQNWLVLKRRKFLLGHYEKSLIASLETQAKSLSDMGNYQKALGIFLKINHIIKTHKGNQINDYDLLGNYSNIASVLTKLERYNEAAALFTDVIQKWQTLYNMNFQPEITLKGIAVALLNRGTVYERLQQYEKAITDFKRSIDFADRLKSNVSILGDGYFNLGNVYVGWEKNHEAIAAYTSSINIMEKAIESDQPIYFPDYLQALIKRGHQYKTTKQSELAKKDFSLAIEHINKNTPVDTEKLLETYMEGCN